MTTGAKLFLLGLFLLPALLIGSMVVENQQPASKSVAKKKEKQVDSKQFYEFVKKNKEWFPFSYGLLKFYFE